jgi:hypothetical protein
MIEKILERLEEEREIAYADFYEYLMKFELDNDFDEDDDWFYKGLIRAKKIVQEVAREYGKDTNVPSRCDTCTHYVADEVPPICYMCSKGIEDNYQKGE